MYVILTEVTEEMPIPTITTSNVILQLAHLPAVLLGNSVYGRTISPSKHSVWYTNINHKQIFKE